MVVATAAVFFLYRSAGHITVYRESSLLIHAYRFFTFKWAFDVVYNRFVNKPTLEGAYNITFSLIDKGLLEVVGPTGLGRATIQIGRLLAKAQTGRAYDYAGVLLISLFVVQLVLDLRAPDIPLMIPVIFLQRAHLDRGGTDRPIR